MNGEALDLDPDSAQGGASGGARVWSLGRM
jgi:hypothetical protein